MSIYVYILYVCLYVCIFVFLHTYIYIYIYTYIYISDSEAISYPSRGTARRLKLTRN